jgi:phosphoglycerol transferase MdoB-like AlkP superfamily enzyme
MRIKLFIQHLGNLLPVYIKTLIKHFAISLFMMTICRIIFLFANSDSFSKIGFNELGASLWYDLITICIFYIPYYSLWLIPFKNRKNKVYLFFFKILFHLTNTTLLFLNLIDVEYFKYTAKRSTADVFSMVSSGQDFKQLAGTFLSDFWWIVLCFIFLVYISNVLLKKTIQNFQTSTFKTTIWRQTLTLLFITPLLLIIGRGGVGLRPIGIIEASSYTSIENTALILNTPFTILKSMGKKPLDLKNYFTEQEAEKLFNPIRVSSPQHILPDNTNVVILILESFGNEFVGTENLNKTSYTPFLDSLIDKSLYFKNGFANGKKSIEAVPAILASIPSLMDNPYISSPYGNNQIKSLPAILKKHGYESAFFHGATNGSMRFDSFSDMVGFDHYFGRNEYGNDDHFDNTWGILDEYFNPWSAKKMSELKEPFISTLFTLSSHHPYFIPNHMKGKVKEGPKPIYAAINYGDYALQLFFNEAKKQKWYSNTLFVIMADHTPATSSVFYSQRNHMYQIPIAFYHPGGKINIKKEDQIFQQLDVMPTLLDLLNIKIEYYSFGSSYYDLSEKHAITYLEGTYHFFFKNLMLNFSNDQARNLYDYKVRTEFTTDSLALKKQEIQIEENRLKAIIQRYNRDLVQNQMTVK